jgi:hypothetical protein
MENINTGYNAVLAAAIQCDMLSADRDDHSAFEESSQTPININRDAIGLESACLHRMS